MISDSMQDPSPLNFSDKDRLDKVKNGLTTDQKFASKTNALRTGPSPIATERSITQTLQSNQRVIIRSGKKFRFYGLAEKTRE